MSNKSDAGQCPGCGAEIPAEAPQGLCPKCLLEGVSSPTEGGDTTGEAREAPPIDFVAAGFPELEIIELIGQGGMGFVYKARQPKLDRHVALKILPERLAEDAAFRERFAREGRVLASLNHPNIVTVYDFGEANGFFYLMMEFVDGVNLRQAMNAGRFTPGEALKVVPHICDALQFAHGEGVLHRDIKPANILMDSKGRVKIADFGIAKIVGESKPGTTLTGSGYALGTPHYMAPEQIEKPGTVDHRADIYSLGVVFYELLTGELPLGRFALPSEKSTADPSVDEVVLRALDKERERRQQSADEMKTEVEHATRSVRAGTPQAAKLSAAETGDLLLASRAHFSTPERLRSFKGRFSAPFLGSGEARLYRNHLTLVNDDQPQTIPLKSIRDVSVGHFQWWAQKGVQVPFVSVTHEVNGIPHTLTLTLREQWVEPLSDTNRITAHAAEEIRKATAAVSEKEPGKSPKAGVSIDNPPSWILSAMIAVLLFCPLFGFMGAEIVGNGEKHHNNMAVIAGFGLVALSLAAAIAGVLASICLAHTRRAIALGNLQALTERHPEHDKSREGSQPLGPEGTQVVRRRWSKCVIISAVANVLSLAPAAILIVFAVLMISDDSWNPGAGGELVFMILTIASWLALASTGVILAVAGIRKIVASGGRLRSWELAHWCAWLWPIATPLLLFAFLLTRHFPVTIALAYTILATVPAWYVYFLTRRRGRSHAFEQQSPWNNQRIWIRRIAALSGLGMMLTLAIVSMMGKSSPGPGIGAIEIVVIFGILGFFAVAMLVVRGVVKHAASPAGNAPRNPWPRRVFYLLLCIVVIPIALLAIAVIVSTLAYQGTQTSADEIERREAAKIEMKELSAKVAAEQARHKEAHVGKGGKSGYFVHDSDETQYVLFYDGDFQSSTASTHNRVSKSWSDRITIRLASGKSLAVARDANANDELAINGAVYDLKDGRVFVLADDAGVAQLGLRPGPEARKDLPGLAGQIEAEHVKEPLEVGSRNDQILFSPIARAEDAELGMGAVITTPGIRHHITCILLLRDGDTDIWLNDLSFTVFARKQVFAMSVDWTLDVSGGADEAPDFRLSGEQNGKALFEKSLRIGRLQGINWRNVAPFELTAGEWSRVEEMKILEGSRQSISPGDESLSAKVEIFLLLSRSQSEPGVHLSEGGIKAEGGMIQLLKGQYSRPSPAARAALGPTRSSRRSGRPREFDKTIENEYRFPDGALVRVNVTQRAKDNSEKEIGKELIFQLLTGVDGDLRLRWQAARPDAVEGAGQWKLQLVQGHDDFLIKEFAGSFEKPVRFSSEYDRGPAAPKSDPHELNKPDVFTFCNFLRAWEIVEDGKPVVNWWDLRARVQLVSPKHKDVVTEFLVPAPSGNASDKTATDAGPER